MDTRPQWIQVFQAAILERDAAQLPDKITRAKHAIRYRVAELHGVNADSERFELRAALQTLAELGSEEASKHFGIATGHEF